MFLAILAVSATSSHAFPEPRTMPASMLDQLAIPRDYDIVFQDASGTPISFDRFQAGMASRPFDVNKDGVRHHAVLKLQGDGAIAKGKQHAQVPKSLPIAGKPFPSFSATTLDGTPVSLQSLRGKRFMANFFFAQCAPCIAETPVLSAFHRAHPETPVVAFTFDDAATARDFVRQRGLNWPVVAGQAELAEAAGVKVYPVMMLVDANGIVAKAMPSDALRVAGQPLTVGDVERWIDAPR